MNDENIEHFRSGFKKSKKSSLSAGAIIIIILIVIAIVLFIYLGKDSKTNVAPSTTPINQPIRPSVIGGGCRGKKFFKF